MAGGQELETWRFNGFRGGSEEAWGRGGRGGGGRGRARG